MMDSGSSSPPPLPSTSAAIDNDDEPKSITADEVNIVEVLEPQHQSCLQLLRSALSNPDQLIAMISNYSTSYNAVNVGIVLPVLTYSLEKLSMSDSDHERHSPKSNANYYGAPPSTYSSISRQLQNNNNKEENDEQDSIVASSLLAGMIIGQLIGGYLGDLIGRREAIVLVMILQIGGSLGSALFINTTNSEGTGLTVLEQLAIWRFILGIGAGGVYPLAAVMSAENKQEKDTESMIETENISANAMQNGDGDDTNNYDQEFRNDRVNNRQIGRVSSAMENGSSNAEQVSSFQRISLTFSTQGLGFITVPILAYPMLTFGMNTNVIWRLLLGVGAIPGIVVLYLRLRASSSSKQNESTKRSTNEIIDSIDSPGNTSTGSSSHDALELPPNRMDDGSPVQTISTLFNDITNSSSDEDKIGDGDNELALVDNCHRGSDHANYEIQHNEHEECDNMPISPVDSQPRGLWESIRSEPNLGRKFMGTAGTWFLFDVLFYGNTLFEPLVLEAAFGGSSSSEGYDLLLETVRDSLVISMLSLPGYFITVLLIGRRTCTCQRRSTTRYGSASCFPCEQTPVYIQMQGFMIMFILYIIIGVWWTSLDQVQWLLVVLYAGTFFFANYGPNTTTFLLPSVTYSEECRSTLNGFSAAAGKLGAFAGAAMFAPAADRLGESIVMIFCGVISLLAALTTKCFLGRTKKSHEKY